MHVPFSGVQYTCPCNRNAWKESVGKGSEKLRVLFSCSGVEGTTGYLVPSNLPESSSDRESPLCVLNPALTSLSDWVNDLIKTETLLHFQALTLLCKCREKEKKKARKWKKDARHTTKHRGQAAVQNKKVVCHLFVIYTNCWSMDRKEEDCLEDKHLGMSWLPKEDPWSEPMWIPEMVAHDKVWGMKSKSWRITSTSLTPELIREREPSAERWETKRNKTMSVWKSGSNFALSKAAV